VSKERISLGNKGEELAANFLKENGYKIICRNYKTKLGEIDIIAKEKGAFCFIEVKTRASDRFGLGSEAVSRLKQRQVAKAALSFLKEKGLLNRKARFDVISIDYFYPKARVNLIKNAFDLDGAFTY